MKKTVLYVFAFLLLTSCKNFQPKSMIAADTQIEMAANPSTLVNNADEPPEQYINKNNDFLLVKNSAKGWTPSEKTTFMTACVEGTTEAMGESKSANYCACLLNKLEKLYPVADEVINLPEKKQSEVCQQCLQE